MKHWIRWSVFTGLMAYGMYYILLWIMPYIIMNSVLKKLDVKVNQISHSTPIDENFRTVVKPSPDLLYSVCGFDVSLGPVKVFAEIPKGTYFSISGFADNTDNFFALNNEQFQGEQAKIVLAAEDYTFGVQPSGKVIRVPSSTGIILFRSLIKDLDKVDELFDYQKKAACDPI